MNLLNEVSLITDHLYLTNWTSSNNKDLIKKYNIKAVVSAEIMDKPQLVSKFYDELGIKHLHIKINDTPDEDISKYFIETYKFINGFINSGQNVMVHCMAGISRSTTIVINYLLRKLYEDNNVSRYHRDVVNDIVDFVRERRNYINPNPGFMQKLYTQSEIYANIKVWELFPEDITPAGDLKNNLTSIVIFCKEQCDNIVSASGGLTDITKYNALYDLVKPYGIKIYIVYSDADYTQYTSDDNPFIVGIYKGKFFSEYGLDPSNIIAYGDLLDLKKFALELGTDVVIHNKIT